MAGSRSHFHIAISSGGLDTESGREFFQERLKIFAFWNGLLSFSFVPLRLGLEAAFAQDFSWSGVLRRPGVLPHLTASLTMMLVWLVTRRSRIFPIRTLTRIDALATCLVGTSFALMGAALAVDGGVLISDRMVAMLTATLAIAFTVIWRAVAIPSTPSRTAVVTAIAILPLVAADIWMLAVARPQGAANAPAAPFAVLWAVVTLALSIVASNVIYRTAPRGASGAASSGSTRSRRRSARGRWASSTARATRCCAGRPRSSCSRPTSRRQSTSQRFEREVQLTAQLTHPNTVAVFDYGRTPDGVFYYAMEYLDGIDLEDLVGSDGPQPAGARRPHPRAGVRGARRGARHRPHPSRHQAGATSSSCERGGVPDVAKVVDFGLVKELDAANGSTTRSADTICSWARRSTCRPRRSPRADRVDARSDLYALGAVGYFLLTGTPSSREGRHRGLRHHLHTQPTAFGAPGTCRQSAARSAAARMSREGSGAPACDRDGGSRDPRGK